MDYEQFFKGPSGNLKTSEFLSISKAMFKFCSLVICIKKYTSQNECESHLFTYLTS